MRYAIKEYIDPMPFRYDRDGYLEHVKRAMAHQLARAFIERLGRLEPERDPSTGNYFLSFEMEITDQMELDRIRTMSRREGRMIGQSDVISKIPYGMNPDDVWE